MTFLILLLARNGSSAGVCLQRKAIPFMMSRRARNAFVSHTSRKSEPFFPVSDSVTAIKILEKLL